MLPGQVVAAVAVEPGQQAGAEGDAVGDAEAILEEPSRGGADPGTDGGGGGSLPQLRLLGDRQHGDQTGAFGTDRNGYVVNANGQRNTQGRVTSSYASPTLGRPIAMGLVQRGPERMGEELAFEVPGATYRARIVDPVFYDKEGAKANV